MSDETKVERKESSEQKEKSDVEKPRAEEPKVEESKTFTSLAAYENVFPIVVRTLKLIESLDQFKIRHEVLLRKLYESSTGIILNLAITDIIEKTKPSFTTKQGAVLAEHNLCCLCCTA